jgi:hypothetical protein
MDKNPDQDLEAFIGDIDRVLLAYQDRFAAHMVAGMLLSRVTLLMTMDPKVGKSLLMYVWEQLDQIDRADPSSWIP